LSCRSRGGKVPFPSDAAVEALFEKHKLAAATLKGQSREKALRGFQADRWYGAAEVDQLSEHEARVIAARLVNRARLDIAPNRRPHSPKSSPSFSPGT
jgi:hypothetical protein